MQVVFYIYYKINIYITSIMYIMYSVVASVIFAICKFELLCEENASVQLFVSSVSQIIIGNFNPTRQKQVLWE